MWKLLSRATILTVSPLFLASGMMGWLQTQQRGANFLQQNMKFRLILTHEGTLHLCFCVTKIVFWTLMAFQLALRQRPPSRRVCVPIANIRIMKAFKFATLNKSWPSVCTGKETCLYTHIATYLWKSSMQWIWFTASTVNGTPSRLFAQTTHLKQLGWYGLPVALSTCEVSQNRFVVNMYFYCSHLQFTF